MEKSRPRKARSSLVSSSVLTTGVPRGLWSRAQLCEEHKPPFTSDEEDFSPKHMGEGRESITPQRRMGTTRSTLHQAHRCLGVQSKAESPLLESTSAQWPGTGDTSDKVKEWKPADSGRIWVKCPASQMLRTEWSTVSISAPARTERPPSAQWNTASPQKHLQR